MRFIWGEKMETARFGKNIKKVVRLEADPNGKLVPVVVHQTKSKRRKSKGTLGMIDRVVREVVGANQAIANSYMSRHDTSSRKRPDGWLSEMPVNIIRSQQKGLKKLRMIRFVSL
jgi:hypothetical protein